MAQYQLFERYPVQQLEDSSSDEEEIPYNYSNSGTANSIDVQHVKKIDLLLSSDDELNQSSSSSSSDSSDSSSSDDSDNESVKYFSSSEDEEQSIPVGQPAKRAYSSISENVDDGISHKRQKLNEIKELTKNTNSSKPSALVPPNNTVKSASPNFNNIYSGTSLKMMEKMGYKKDSGLGKSGQGRIELINAAEHKGRRGLGLKLDGLDRVAVKLDPSTEKLSIPEKVDWIENNESAESLLEFSMDILTSWVKRGPKKSTIYNETKFCDFVIL